MSDLKQLAREIMAGENNYDAHLKAATRAMILTGLKLATVEHLCDTETPGKGFAEFCQVLNMTVPDARKQMDMARYAIARGWTDRSAGNLKYCLRVH